MTETIDPDLYACLPLDKKEECKKSYISPRQGVTFDEEGNLIAQSKMWCQGDKVVFPGFGNFIPIYLFGVDENTVFEIVDFYTVWKVKSTYIVYDGEPIEPNKYEVVMVLLRDRDGYKYRTRASNTLYFAEKVEG